MDIVKLSIVIITYNEERYIEDAVRSALFTDEVLVLDSGSTDETCTIASNLGARVKSQQWLGFGAQKNKAIALAKNDFVFVLDADERISEALKNEITKLLEDPQSDGYFVPRLIK